MIAATAGLAALVLGLPAAAAADGGPGATAGLGGDYRQPVTWHGCQDEELDSAGVRGAGLRGPLDYRRPHRRNPPLQISPVRATRKGHPDGGLFIHTRG